MHILFFSLEASWIAELPDAARTVGSDAENLATDGHSVTTITARAVGRPAHSNLIVATLPPRNDGDDPLAKILQANNAMVAAASSEVREAKPDVIHAHGWAVAWAAAAIGASFDIPIVSSIDGVPADGDDIAWQATWWLTYISRRTLLPSEQVRAATEARFLLPHGKQDVVTDASGAAASYRAALQEQSHLLFPRERRAVHEVRALWRQGIERTDDSSTA